MDNQDVREAIFWIVASIIAGSLIFVFTIGLIAALFPHPWDTIIGIPGWIACCAGVWHSFDQQ